MTSPQKRKGHAAERKVVERLHHYGFKDAARIQAGTHQDIGDVSGVPGVVFEVKDRQQHNWKEYFEQLMTQMANADAVMGAVIIKRPLHTNADEWIAAMPFREFIFLVSLLTETRYERTGK